MIDYTVRHLNDVPDYTLPPVHFGGIRFSGDSSSNRFEAIPVNSLLPYLKRASCDEETQDYGSSSWFDVIDQCQSNAYVGNYATGMQYQFFVGQYSPNFPAYDSSRWFVINDVVLDAVDLDPEFLAVYNDGICDLSSLSLIIPAYDPTGNAVGCSTSTPYSFGWGDTLHSSLRFSPHLKEGCFRYNSRSDDYNDLTEEQKAGQFYQFGFLVGNDCDEIDIEFEIINEHPLISWDFTLGACVNKQDISTWEMSTRDSDLELYSPKIINEVTGYCSGYYGDESGDCSSTKYNVTLRNVNCREGAGLVQVSVLNMDFNSRGEDYLPFSLYDKITPTGSEINSQWKDEFSQYFWKGRYTTPTAFHLHPWYNRAKSSNWASATGFFEAPQQGYIIEPAPELGGDRSATIDHGGPAGPVVGPSYAPPLGNYSNDSPTWTTSSFRTVGPILGNLYCQETQSLYRAHFFNYGGFGRIIQEDANVDGDEWDRTCEFAPVSITVNSITAKKRKKHYYATYPITGIVSGKYLGITDPTSGLMIGNQIHHICEFDYGRLGPLNGTAPHYTYIYDRTPTQIAVKETKSCDPISCAWSFSPIDIINGVARVLTKEKTGYFCRFESGSEFVFSPHKFQTGDLISFNGISPINQFQVLENEDYIVSFVDQTFLGGDDEYQFKIRTPRYESDTSKPNKIFNQEISCSGYVGNILSGVREAGSYGIFDASAEFVSVENCASVLPSTLNRYTQYYGLVGDTVVATTLGPC